ncbi:response regulator [Owenweeksia hongkongensis]|uniref:response regulator n=1 Tax=Owenweeksia hongkongensis TaxID=253245 RepID=UPI003A93042A
MNKSVVFCLIDDDDIYQYTFTRKLKRTNIPKKILVFSDGEEAIDFMSDNLSNIAEIPDIIFLDINMPVMDGWEFLEEFVKLKPKVGKEVTLYMVSSSVDPRDMERAQKISAVSDYLIKPVTETQILELMTKM